MKNTFAQILLFVLTLLWTGLVASMPITNGDFEAGLNGWSDASGNGSASSFDGHALLSAGQGADPYSAILAQGDDGWFSFDNPVVLPEDTLSINFDAWIHRLETDPTETGGSLFGDWFSLAVYDAEDFSFDRYFEDVALNWSQEQYSFDISGLAGRSVALSFELVDENDGFDLSIGLDNIFIGTQGVINVSEPSSLILIALGLLALMRARAR